MIPKAKKQLIALCSDRELPTLLGKVASGDKEKTVKIAGCKAFHGLNELKVLDAKKCDKIKEQFYALKDNKRAKKNLEEATKQYNAEKGKVSAAAGSGGGGGDEEEKKEDDGGKKGKKGKKKGKGKGKKGEKGIFSLNCQSILYTAYFID